MASWYIETDKLNEIAVSSRVRLARNLKDMPFPCRMTKEMFASLKNRVKTTIDELASEGIKLRFIEMNDVPENEVGAMVERHVISPDFAANCNNRAIAISDDESISIMIGEEDHIRIQVIVAGFNLEDAYKTADMLDTALGERLGFAYDERLGFLTECPTNIGTGLRASVMLHLPVCENNGDIASIADAAGKIGLTVRGMYGEGSKAKASLYQVSNQITLGISEKNAIKNLNVIVHQIIDREKQSRKLIDRVKIEDSVMRAFGTLKYAKLISTEEFMKLISLIKLGMNEGIIDNVNISPIRLLIEAQPFMVMRKYSVSTSVERDEARARIVGEFL